MLVRQVGNLRGVDEKADGVGVFRHEVVEAEHAQLENGEVGADTDVHQGDEREDLRNRRPTE